MKMLLLFILSFMLNSNLHADHHEPAEAAKDVEVKSKPLRHIVMFKFKDDATKEQVAAIEKAFGELPKKIETIKGYEWGTNISKENKSQGFTHCFVVTFDDQKGLDVYGPHDAHQAFVKQLLPILDKVLVLDFIAQ